MAFSKLFMDSSQNFNFSLNIKTSPFSGVFSPLLNFVIVIAHGPSKDSSCKSTARSSERGGYHNRYSVTTTCPTIPLGSWGMQK